MTMAKVSRRDQHAELSTQARALTERAAACDTATLYTYPTKNTTFDVASGALTFKWEPSCLSFNLAILILQAPHLAVTGLKRIEGVAVADGSFTVELDPIWWNGAASVDVQMTLANGDSSLPAFVGGVAAGPLFEVVYTAPPQSTGAAAAAAASTAVRNDPIVVVVNKQATSALPTGSIFAAAFFPIVAVAAAATFYILWIRKKQAKKSKRWSAAVDQRMSRISTEWRGSMHESTMGTPDMRQSGDRRTVMSMHSTTTGAPNFAGRGVYRGDDTTPGSPYTGDDYAEGFEKPPRASFVGSGAARVSFSEGTRPTSTYTHHVRNGSKTSAISLTSAAAGGQTVGSRKSYQAPNGSRLSLGQPPAGPDTKGRWSVAGPVATNLDMRVAPEATPWVLGEEEEQEVLGPVVADMPARPQVASRRSEGAVPLSVQPPTARLISPMQSPIVGCPPSPDLGQASASWFGMTPSTSQNSLSPDEKLQRHASAQGAAAENKST